MTDRRPHWPIAALVLAYVGAGFIYAVTTPLFEASDELWHYPMVQTLAAGNGLPVQDPAHVGPWRQEASQPPLYYYLMALVTRGIDQADMREVRWLNPHVDNGVVTPDGNTNLAIHTERERWPWRGAVLAVRLVRLLSVVLSAAAVYLTYRLSLELEPGRRDLALAAAAFAGFTPMVAFIGGAVNNDNLAVPLASASVLALVHFARSGGWGWFERFGRWAGVWACACLGALIGMGALTKQSALGLIPLAGVTLAYLVYRHWEADGRRNLVAHGLKWIGAMALTVGIAAAIAGWWYARNLRLYGDLLGWSAFVAVLGTRERPASILQLWGERSGFMQSYWGLFGGVNIPMPGWVYAVLNALAVAAVLGLAAYAWRKFRREGLALEAWVPIGIIAAWIALIVLGIIRWATVTWSSQGRLAFYAISSIAVLFVFGLTAWLPRRWQPWAAGGVALFMAGLTLAAPFAWIAPAYASPRPPTASELAAIPNRVDADFGGEMTLLGYAVSPRDVRPGEPVEVTLYWQGQIAMDRDWSVFVHLQDEHQIVVAQRDTYPGLGKLPTRLIAPGRTFADRYVIRVPRTAYAPSRLQVVVGLYDRLDGARLGVGQGDSLALASVDLRSNPGEVPNPQDVNFANQVRLVGYDIDRRVASPGESLKLQLFWQGVRGMSVNYSIFTHVRGEGESLWASSDAWPQQGAAPTSTWTPGQTVPDAYTLTLSSDIPPGVYDIEIGVYNAETGERLQVITPDGRLTSDYVYLSKVRVAP